MTDQTGPGNAGAVTRRTALLALLATLPSPSLLAQPARPVIRTRRLNNVMIAVSNVERSAAFYEKLFGPPVRQGDAAVFRVGEGPHFFALMPVRGRRSAGLSLLRHDGCGFRCGASEANAGRPGAPARSKSTRRATRPSCSSRIPTASRFSFRTRPTDMARVRTVTCFPPAPATNAQPAFRLKSLNHVTLTIANGAREKEFYQSVFGLPIRAMQGDGVTLAIGEGTDGIVFNAAANNPTRYPASITPVSRSKISMPSA